MKQRVEDGVGGGLFLTTTWRPKRKRRMQSGTGELKLRKRGCARQTLPTVELKCYCKVTCKVPVRQTLTPSYRLTSSQSVPSFSQAKSVTQQLEQWSLNSVQYWMLIYHSTPGRLQNFLLACLVNPASWTREALKGDYHLNGDSLAPPCTLCKQPHECCEG